MFGVRQLFLLVIIGKVLAIFAGNFTVSVEWYPEKYRTYSFNRNIFGECILSLQEDMVRCMRNHRFQEIEDQWRYNPENVTYLAVNCLKQVRVLNNDFYKLYHFILYTWFIRKSLYVFILFEQFQIINTCKLDNNIFQRNIKYEHKNY